MEYTKLLTEQYQRKMNNIYKNINHNWGIFPDRNEPLKQLFVEEYILKTIFIMRICFLSELQILYAYCFSIEKISQIIKSLEEQGYIISKTIKGYGKCFILSKTALHYIYNNGNDDNFVTEDTFPNEAKLITYKVLNGYFSNLVFSQMTADLREQYTKESPDFRRNYQKEQYIKNYMYSSKKAAYNKKEVDSFVAANMDKLETNEEEKKKYQGFIKAFKENRDKQYISDNFLQYAFLKDYYNQTHHNRLEALNKTFSIFKAVFTNFYRDTLHKFRKDLCSLAPKSDRLQNEYKLFLYCELQRIFTINKRALNNTNLDNKSTEELKELTQKIQNLDSKIKSYDTLIQDLSSNYETMVFDKYSVSDVALFKSDVVTLEKLKALNVYIIDSYLQENGRTKICFGIVQSSSDESMATTMIFQRLERIFYYYINNLLSLDMEIKILVYTPDEAQSVKAKLRTVEESFRELTQYSLLIPFIKKIQIISTKQQLEERFKILKTFRSRCKAF